MNIVLGTAALGFPYGIVNQIGRMDYNQVIKIVETAWKLGIREFDTAQMYEASEFYLGQAFIDLGIQDEVKVITKFDPMINIDLIDMLNSVSESLEKLKVDKLYGTLLHREYLLNQPMIMEILQALKEKGLTEKIGASVYLPSYAEKAMNMKELDIVQFPSCILDRRFERAGIFELAEKNHKEIYLRNILLQGLLLVKPEDCPMEWIRPELKKLDSISNWLGLSKLQLIISFMKTNAPNAKLIFGAETPEQLTEIMIAYGGGTLLDEWMMNIRKVFSDVEDRVLIPKMWKEDK